MYVDTGSEVSEPFQWSLDTDGCRYFQRPPYLSSSKSGVIKLVLDPWILKTDRSNDWTPTTVESSLACKKSLMALCLHQQNWVQLFLSVAKKTLRSFLSKSGRSSFEFLALQGALFTLQRWLCRTPYGRRLEGIVVHGIFRRYFCGSEMSICVAEVTSWRQVEKQIHE